MKKPNSFPLIYADNRGLLHKALTEQLIGIFYDVYNELGHGFIESVYEEALSISLSEHQIPFQRQIPIPVFFHGRQIGDFRADLLIENKVLIELKAGRGIDLSWEKQVLNYLRGTAIEVGLLFNFGPEPQFRRCAFANERKEIRDFQRRSAEKN